MNKYVLPLALRTIAAEDIKPRDGMPADKAALRSSMPESATAIAAFWTAFEGGIAEITASEGGFVYQWKTKKSTPE